MPFELREIGLEPELLEVVKGAGVTVHTLTKDERSQFEKATLDVRAAFRKNQGKKAAEILDLVEEGIKEFRDKAGE